MAAANGSRLANLRFLVGLARAAGGALIFSLPLLMTMELWWLGFYMGRLQLALLTLVTFPLLVLLSHYVGFERTFDWREDVVDALAAYAVAVIMAVVLHPLLVIAAPGDSFSEIIGKIALQAVPGAIGALLALSQLGQAQEEDGSRRRHWQEEPSYPRELFLMLLGALFLSLNLAPTEEMVLIGHRMPPLYSLLLVVLSLLLMHAFVYSVEFRGQHDPGNGHPGHARLFLHYTVAGYGIVLLTSLFILWTFGRFEGVGMLDVVAITVVLAFPASIGAAAARLIL